MSKRLGSYSAYCVAVGVVWAVLLVLAALLDSASTRNAVLLVFAGFVIAWLSATIARVVYPPPKKYRRADGDG